MNLTVREAGSEIGVSDATIIRFARAVGYDGYTDLQEQIRRETEQKKEKIGKHSLSDRYTIQMQRYHLTEYTGNDMIKFMGMNLETSLRQNGEEVYEKIANRILNARRKLIIGFRGGKGCALQFSRLLSHITEGVNCLTEEGHDQICKLAELDENDMVVFLNFSRYYKIDEKLGSMIGEKQIPCILITDSMASPLAKYADEMLLVETEYCGFFHSMIGVQGVLEYLIILMCWKKPEQFQEKLKERDRILSDYRVP